MIQIKGKYTTAEIMTDSVESEVIKQVTFLCNHPLFELRPIKVMPDCHPAKATVVGLSCKIDERYAIPALIGSDIGCNVLAIRVEGNTLHEYSKLDKVIRKIIKEPYKVGSWLQEKISYIAKRIGTDKDKYINTFCTLGGGNHFISLEKGETGTWLIVHTGSRNFGKDIYLYYMTKALEEGLYKGGEEKQLSWLDKSSEEYYESVLIAQQYARGNSSAICHEICKEMKWKEQEQIYCPHNYIDWGAPVVLHKGSIRLANLEKGVIPINMADGTLIVEGHGNNEEWLYSAPHGAGRLMSREQAKSSLSMKEYKDRMKHVYSSNVNTGTIDESPMAYKPMEEIMEKIEPICKIIDHLRPVYNCKGI